MWALKNNRLVTCKVSAGVSYVKLVSNAAASCCASGMRRGFESEDLGRRIHTTAASRIGKHGQLLMHTARNWLLSCAERSEFNLQCVTLCLDCLKLQKDIAAITLGKTSVEI
jgi:hypothetical protein